MTIVESFHYARPHEVHALEELQRRAVREHEEYRQRLADNPDGVRVSVVAVRDQRIRVAVGEGRILGFSTVVPAEHRLGRLDALWVEPEGIDPGVAEAILDDAIALAADEGIVLLEVMVAERQVPFYEAAGFSQHEPMETSFGPAIRMTRDL